MTRFDEKYETPKWRTFWLIAAFALLIGIGVVTVLLPELEDEPESSTQELPKEESDEAPHTEPLQE